MDSSDAENDTQPTALRRNLLKLTAGVGVTAVVGSSSVTAYYDDNDPDYASPTGSVSFASPEDGATKQNPVTFEMEATDFTIEPASSGVSDGAGHFHILVDQRPLPAGEVIPNNEENGYYHYGGGQKTAELDLDPGEHTVRLQAGDANHRAYDLTDTVSVTADGSTSSEQSTFTMNNVGANAWEVLSTNEEYVETSGGDNPTITLETGVRYTISNEGWNIHPLAFRDGDQNKLLSQGRNQTGEFENDGDVNWNDSGSTLSFTLTDELANRINSYICTVHSNMEGTIDVSQDAQITGDVVDLSNNNVPGAEVTLREETTTGTFVEIANTTTGPSGSFSFISDDGVRSGENYTVEATFTDEEGNEGTGFAQIFDIPGGTTSADIVIEGINAPEGFEIEDGSFEPPASAAPGDEIEISADVTNTAGEEATSPVTFVFDNSEETSQNVTLGPSATTPVSFTLVVPDVVGGEYVYGIETDTDSETATITVEDGSGEVPPDAVYEPGSTAAEFDDDGNGQISISELGTAGSAYSSGNLSISEFAEVGAAYSASDGN